MCLSPDTVMSVVDENAEALFDAEVAAFYESLEAGGYTESEIAVLEQAWQAVFGPGFGEEEELEAAVGGGEGFEGREEEAVPQFAGVVLAGGQEQVAEEAGPPPVLIIPHEGRETPSPLDLGVRAEHEELDEVRADLFGNRAVRALFSPIRSESARVVEDGDEYDEGKCPSLEEERSIGALPLTTQRMEI